MRSRWMILIPIVALIALPFMWKYADDRRVATDRYGRPFTPEQTAAGECQWVQPRRSGEHGYGDIVRICGTVTPEPTVTTHEAVGGGGRLWNHGDGLWKPYPPPVRTPTPEPDLLLIPEIISGSLWATNVITLPGGDWGPLVIEDITSWHVEYFRVGPDGTITIADPFARAMRDAIGRLK